LHERGQPAKKTVFEHLLATQQSIETFFSGTSGEKISMGRGMAHLISDSIPAYKLMMV
jgi:hypothetical protein